MTGRELIIYIMQNGLEDKEIFANDTFLDLMTMNEAAAKFKVGIYTIRSWYLQGYIHGVSIGDSVYIFKNTEDPRKNKSTQIKENKS